jgi:uncharacterized protein GlcG (DUF336 family)
MIRLSALAAAASLAAFTYVNAWAADPLPTVTYKILPLALAMEAAQTAIATCKGQGYNVSAAVVDMAGTTQLIARGDGASNDSRELARRKAYTAANRKITTGELAKRVAQPGAFNPTIYNSELVLAQGGIPIKAGNETIGAIGVSGAPGGDKDEACASSGLSKIGDQLN